ncbi:Dabb family protein [Halosquirtibacter xylanolyticus]|uniref:Dabb family protein n=1 Tax=Halosquirtibacter xylanolyticus TaxID=3374599 RepID=UPI00374847C5|nr:Dabb family protein [Prolixibacteraceae bacterium]
MINHTVLFKVKDFQQPEDKKAALEEIKAALMGLEGQIEQLRHIEVQLHYTLQSDSFDVALITHFDSIADVDIYQVHPLHQDAVKVVKQYAVGRACVDFEF